MEGVGEAATLGGYCVAPIPRQTFTHFVILTTRYRFKSTLLALLDTRRSFATHSRGDATILAPLIRF